MDYDLIVVKTLERVYKNYYYIIRGEFLLYILLNTLRLDMLYGKDFLAILPMRIVKNLIMWPTDYIYLKIYNLSDIK